MRKLLGLIVGLVLLAIAAMLPSLGLPTFYVSLLTQAFILGIAACGLDLLIGQTGMVSFAHASFFGIGAYTVAIMTTRHGAIGYTQTLLPAIGVALAVSLVFGLVALRASGVGFLIITLALNQIVWGVGYQWVSMTGGENGITGFFRPAIGDIRMTNPNYYLYCLGMLALAVVVLWLVFRSPFGMVLEGIREQPRRMRALGYNTWAYQYAAFVIAGTFAGLAGGLFAYYNSFASPADLTLPFSTQMLIMVILGGAGTLFGPLLGSVIIIFLGNALSDITQRWPTILGLIYVLVVMYAPEGIVGIVRQRLLPALRQRLTRPRPRPGNLAPARRSDSA